MKTHVDIKRVEKAIVRMLTLLLLVMMAAPMVPAQAPPNPVPAAENIFAGALVIPMDNFHQGNPAQTTFNLRAYGLANLLLQNDIPVKWAIKPGKSKDDVDFTANVTRMAGTQGVAGPTTASFAGGPFIITRQFDTPFVQNLISTFNNGGNPVTVYRTNADALVDIRYTLTHKPKIAVGPDGGNFGSGVFQGLFDRAGIPNYVTGIDDIDSAGACFTLATQGHQTNPAFVNTYRQFVQNGGNLFLQCASVDTFENNVNGHFQTTGAGYTVFTSNPPTPTEVNSNAFAFPEGYMPFSQFLGLLADQDGAVTEYAYAPGAGPANGNRVAATNTGADAGKFVATVSQVNGPTAIGGVVFEMGGHDYDRLDSVETDTELARLNGQRMQLNAVFVPAGTVCTQTPQTVVGFKSVRRFNVRQGGPPLIAGDTVQWTIDYVNNENAIQFNFQIQDIINEFNQYLIFVPGSVSLTLYGGATATLNPAFTGSGAGTTLDLLGPNAELPPGGRIQVKLRTLIDPNAPRPYVMFNQTTARSNTIQASPSTKSDAVDATNAGIFSQDPPPLDSIPQVQNGAIIDPTRIEIPAGPTAANVAIEGNVINQDGAGIRNALVSVTNASTGELVTVRTNAFGFFRVGDLQAGNLYVISVRHKQYRFGDPVVVSLTDDMTGLSFTGLMAKGNNLRIGN